MDRDREREKGVGYRGYVTLVAWREDGFVFSGEQLALVFQFQHEKLTAVEEYKENYFLCIVESSILFSAQNKRKYFLDR